jgi:succinate dehydrogenase flavin-adding protein (antitoxin of CptAB toxin-antitoxin module)
MTAKELELIKAYKEYIHFLDKDVMAWINGYQCSEQKIEFGQQMRNAIKELEEECGINN